MSKRGKTFICIECRREKPVLEIGRVKGTNGAVKVCKACDVKGWPKASPSRLTDTAKRYATGRGLPKWMTS